MLKVIAIDDDAIARQALCVMAAEHPSPVEIVGEAGTVADAIEIIQKCAPDLVLLDIRLKRGTGFDILNAVDTSKLSVIFTTAYSEYAIKAIQHAAFDYLLKPIDPNELHQVMDRILRIKNKYTTDRLAMLEVLIQETPANNEVVHHTPKKIVLSDAHGFRIVEIDTILWCEGEKNYTTFHLINGQKITTTQSLIVYEKMLKDSCIFRVHKSHMINLNGVKEYVRGRGGHVILSNNKTLAVSREKKSALLTRLNATPS
jgi:two-component system LytT family response regulator